LPNLDSLDGELRIRPVENVITCVILRTTNEALATRRGEMMTMVGIRELKIHLSEYLRKVKNGEPIAVSEHGKEIALITPSGTVAGRSGLWKLLREGSVEWNGGRPQGLRPLMSLTGRPLSQTVIKDREDGV